MPAELLASRSNASLILTISNPGVKNTLHPDVFAAAVETLSTAERDDSIRAVILTGADNYFCAGGNLHTLLEIRTKEKPEQASIIDSMHGWIEAIRDCPKPVIAAVEGGASGAGFSLALACDLIVASASAQFAMSYAQVGLTPDGGASWFLTQTLPRQLAAEILMQGKAIPATRLHALGLVNKLVSDGTALDEALAWGEEFAASSPQAIERIKSLMREAPSNTLSQHFEAEKLNFMESLHHRDAYEGINAFLEKRKPHYK
jgi:enoyl-CoA hydratase/carnithine racemase